jgi:hypothetical protein
MKDSCFLIKPDLNVTVIYVHVPDEPQHAAYAYNLIMSWGKHPPEYYHKFVVACAHKPPSTDMMGMFRLMSDPEIFIHDDSAWDISAYQAYASTATEDMLVFLGGSSYIRRAGWLARMVEVFVKHQGNGIFGACGNTGDSRFNVFPHVRTTGFWCSPKTMNDYPVRITSVAQRYEFEHGPTGICSWARRTGIPLKVADFLGDYELPNFHDGPNGFHKGDQRDLIVGDRLTKPPYYDYE